MTRFHISRIIKCLFLHSIEEDGKAGGGETIPELQTSTVEPHIDSTQALVELA